MLSMCGLLSFSFVSRVERDVISVVELKLSLGMVNNGIEICFSSLLLLFVLVLVNNEG
jgi:hypothetical protein